MKALNRIDKYQELRDKIVHIYQHQKGHFGYRRITLALKRYGYQVNHKAVQRLMRIISLQARIRVKRYRSWKGQTGHIAPNILNRNFNATKPNKKWITDVTEFSINGEKLYLSPVVDVYNSEVIVYSLSEKPFINQLKSMLETAFERLNKGHSPLLHSDQGWQYQMVAYQEKLKARGCGTKYVVERKLS